MTDNEATGYGKRGYYNADGEWIRMTEPNVPTSPSDPMTSQVGGSHYKDMKIQPIEFITANNLGFIEGNICKYASRHRSKNGAEDVRKIIHYARLLLKIDYGLSD